MPVAWQPNRWWDWCLSEDEKREIGPMFIEELYKCVGSIHLGVLAHCWRKNCI